MKIFIANLLSLILISACFAGGRNINQPIDLGIPVSCQIGQDCWFVNYPDEALAQGIRDYRGGSVSQNGKKGLEITIKNIKEEVPVLSAEDGKVLLIKNDIEDNLLTDEGEKDMPFCGNFVLIEHNNAWKTLYCHLKKNSVTVKAGDFAAEGKEVGKIGLSGQTDFPHLYFALLHGGQYFDPFTGNNLSDINAPHEYKPFWNYSAKKSLKYSEVALVNVGASIDLPSINEIKEGVEASELVQDTPLFHLWLHGFHFKPGDYVKLSLYKKGFQAEENLNSTKKENPLKTAQIYSKTDIKIENPSGEKIFEEVKKIPSANFEQVIHFELKKGEEDWEIGSYKGEFEFIRPKQKVSYVPKQKVGLENPKLIKGNMITINGNGNIKSQPTCYKKELSFEIKKSQELIDKELAEKEALKKRIILKKRKLKIYKKLKDEDSLPDSYTQNKLRLW